MVVNPRPGNISEPDNRLVFDLGADSDHLFSAGPLEPRRACFGKARRLFQFRKEPFSDVHVGFINQII